jgi:hypothetical protein
MDEVLKRLITSYLHKNYPVVRLKYNGKFKRSIIFDDGTVFYIGNITHNIIFIPKFVKNICKVFNCEEPIARIIVENFLNIK